MYFFTCNWLSSGEEIRCASNRFDALLRVKSCRPQLSGALGIQPSTRPGLPFVSQVTYPM